MLFIYPYDVDLHRLSLSLEDHGTHTVAEAVRITIERGRYGYERAEVTFKTEDGTRVNTLLLGSNPSAEDDPAYARGLRVAYLLDDPRRVMAVDDVTYYVDPRELATSRLVMVLSPIPAILQTLVWLRTGRPRWGIFPRGVRLAE
ncbi:hypothetical protein [Pengzhenrongella sp.]|jgi:hypothetical protein|uniref:hypothetical protein n=1 Tax=Pengzhenrongella sp. TaxID=2888820 RepID=UPI002F91CCD7